MVASGDPLLVALADNHPTHRQLVAHFRSLPQRDDLGDPDDGPRLAACTPTQRVQLGSSCPNCFERALAFCGASEIARPHHTYQLATIPTDLGPHTFPLVNGKPIVLDPRVTYDCAECGLALATPGPIGVDPRKAIAWTVDLARQVAPPTRNGPSQLYLGKNSIRRLIDEGAVPAPREIDAMGFLFALAERAAHRYGTRALSIVRTAARAIADVIDGVLEHRNARINLGGLKFDTPRWLDDTAGALGNVGLDVGSVIARKQLEGLDLTSLIGLPGATTSIVGLLESELGQKGRTLGQFAHPPELATFAQLARPRVA